MTAHHGMAGGRSRCAGRPTHHPAMVFAAPSPGMPERVCASGRSFGGKKKTALALGLLSGVLLTGPGAAAPFEERWSRAALGCLTALETGGVLEGAPLGLVAAPGLSLPYRAPSDVWRDPNEHFAVGMVEFADGRRLCEVVSTVYLLPDPVNAVYSDFLDWAEVAQHEGRYRFEATRYNRDWLTGLANLTSRFETVRGRRLEVTFVAQPADGRATFSVVEMGKGAE